MNFEPKRFASRSADLARFFQAQYADFDEDLSVYLSLAEQLGGPVLELGCGTGRVLLQLAESKLATVGIDHEQAMLTRLIDQLSAHHLPQPLLVQASLENIPLRETFNLIVAPCNTMAYLPLQRFQDCLLSLRRLVSDRGRLVMDLPAPNQDPTDPFGSQLIESFHEPARGTDVQVSAESSWLSNSVVEVAWHYDEMLADGRINRRSVTTRFHLRSLEAIKRSLEEAGFMIVNSYGDYQRSPFGEDSPGLLIVARPRLN